jgi:hypothetical protein
MRFGDPLITAGPRVRLGRPAAAVLLGPAAAMLLGPAAAMLLGVGRRHPDGKRQKKG